jgi:hypothetical protein
VQGVASSNPAAPTNINKPSEQTQQMSLLGFFILKWVLKEKKKEKQGLASAGNPFDLLNLKNPTNACHRACVV